MRNTEEINDMEVVDICSLLNSKAYTLDLLLPETAKLMLDAEEMIMRLWFGPKAGENGLAADGKKGAVMKYTVKIDYSRYEFGSREAALDFAEMALTHAARDVTVEIELQEEEAQEEEVQE